jgi:HAD superfamily hydrolase (TIGR01509 family)
MLLKPDSPANVCPQPHRILPVLETMLNPESSKVTPKGVIFDLGDVLFTWTSTKTTTIPSKTIRQILSTPTWLDYECGRLTRDECYAILSSDFSLEASQIDEAFIQVRATLQQDPAVLKFLKDLRKRKSVKLYAMSNVAKEDFWDLEAQMDSTLFDRVFTSAEAGMRKPGEEFYRHVLKEINLEPADLIFVDDKEENVAAAESLGIRGFVFDHTTVDKLRAIFDDPVSRGYDYMSQNAKTFDSVTNTGVAVPDNFAELLILEAMEDK